MKFLLSLFRRRDRREEDTPQRAEPPVAPISVKAKSPYAHLNYTPPFVPRAAGRDPEPEDVPATPRIETRPAEPRPAPPSTTLQNPAPMRPATWTPPRRARVQWRPGSFPMAVVGESNYQDALIAICGQHTRYGSDLEVEARIELEPWNSYDPNAVVVKVEDRTVGYLSREQAVRVGGQMREENISGAACGARIRGGWRTNQYDTGHYGVYLAIPEWNWIDFGIGSTPPAKPASSGARKKVERPEAAETGPLRGHRIALIGVPRDGEIAQQLAGQGAHIMAGPGSSTTLFVVNEDRPFSPGMIGSANFRKAQELIAGGSRLRIVSLDEVWTMVAEASE